MIKNKNYDKFTYLYTSLLLILLSIGSFGYVTMQVSKQEITQFDRLLINYIQSYVGPQLTSFVKIFTEIGSVKLVVIFVALTSAILFFKKHYSLSLFVLFASIGGGVFNIVLKTIIQRERPDILSIVEASGYSFPSGHSMGSLIFYGSLAFLIIYMSNNNIVKFLSTISFIILIILIGVSRIYLGVHYPTDVVAGFAFGMAWLVLCITVFRYYEWYKHNRNTLYVRGSNRF